MIGYRKLGFSLTFLLLLIGGVSVHAQSGTVAVKKKSVRQTISGTWVWSHLNGNKLNGKNALLIHFSEKENINFFIELIRSSANTYGTYVLSGKQITILLPKREGGYHGIDRFISNCKGQFEIVIDGKNNISLKDIATNEIFGFTRIVIKNRK